MDSIVVPQAFLVRPPPNFGDGADQQSGPSHRHGGVDLSRAGPDSPRLQLRGAHAR
jgi:hypothetical protein